MNYCSRCGGSGHTHTAYLLDRSKVPGICKSCKEQLECEDVDNMTSECFEKLCHALNGGSFKKLAASMYRTFQRQHRHLQGEFFAALWEFFNLYKDANHDPRNKGAVMTARKWYDAL